MMRTSWTLIVRTVCSRVFSRILESARQISSWPSRGFQATVLNRLNPRWKMKWKRNVTGRMRNLRVNCILAPISWTSESLYPNEVSITSFPISAERIEMTMNAAMKDIREMLCRILIDGGPKNLWNRDLQVPLSLFVPMSPLVPMSPFSTAASLLPSVSSSISCVP